MIASTGTRRSASIHQQQLQLPQMADCKHSHLTQQHHFRIKSLDRSTGREVSNSRGASCQRIELCLKLCALCKEYFAADKLSSMLVVLEELEKHCSPLDGYELAQWFLSMQSRVLLALGEHLKSIQVCKRLKRAARRCEDFKTLTNCHHTAGECRLKLQQYEAALKSFFLMLQSALQASEPALESKAYDLISTAYFRLNQMDRSEHFHKMFLRGHLPGRSSDPHQRHRRRDASSPTQTGESSDEVDLEVLAATYLEPLVEDPKHKPAGHMQSTLHQRLVAVARATGPRVGSLQTHCAPGRTEAQGLSLAMSRSPKCLRLAQLTHLSANRTPQHFEAAARGGGPTSRSQFRFARFGTAVSIQRKAEVCSHLVEFERRLEDCRQRLTRLGASDARVER